MLNYSGLWKLLIDKKMNKTQLLELAGISSATMAKMTKGEAVSMETIIKICEVLDCDIANIVSLNSNEKLMQ